MEYQNLVEDFARRTRENLRQLTKLKDDGVEVYEVTALLNSMLGLLVFPQQRHMNTIPETSIEQLACDGWPVPQVVGDFPQARSLRELIRYLRNAISHFNVEIIGDEEHRICGLVVWNTSPKSKEITWKAKLSISDIEVIAQKFISLILREDAERNSQ